MKKIFSRKRLIVAVVAVLGLCLAVPAVFLKDKEKH